MHLVKGSSSMNTQQVSTEVIDTLTEVYSRFSQYENDLKTYSGARTYIDYTIARLGLKPLRNVRALRPEYGVGINDVTGFNYPIDIAKCTNERNANRTLFIAILSAPNYFEKRQATRETWLHHIKDPHYTRGLLDVVGYGFVLGQTSDQLTQSNIHEEDKQYGDILQVEMDDSYYNLTQKTVAILNWVNSNCARADFVLKVDDDVYVNLHNLANVLSELSPEERGVYGKHVDPGIIGRSPCKYLIN